MKQVQHGMWNKTVRASGLLAILGAFSSLVLIGCPAGGVGDPCIPEDEYRESFAGFKLSEENIESRSFQCETRVCLVNHFQGRTSCPKGQQNPTPCSDDGGCTLPETCTYAGTNEVPCNDSSDCNNPQFPSCEDISPTLRACAQKICSAPNQEDRCYVPGTNTPVAVPVCGQCSGRAEPEAVYCSCRCGAADGQDEGNFNFCECGEGYECAEIRKDLGLGDAQLAGKYCIKQGTTYTSDAQCETVDGFWSSQCAGAPQ